MARYEFTEKQAQNMRALIMDANIKGSAAEVVVELLKCLENPVVEREPDDLHSEHNDRKEPCDTAT